MPKAALRSWRIARLIWRATVPARMNASEQGDHDGGAGDERVALGVVGDVCGLGHGLVGEVRLDLAVGVVLERC